MTETTDSIAARAGSGAAQYPTPPALLPAAHYRDPAQYARELDRAFASSWLPVTPARRLAQARDHVVWQRFGQSVVVVRLDDGGLAAWHNVCQHRGARLVEESGSCRNGVFKCPWHGFAYDLEGRVVHVPLREAFDEEQLRDLRAPAVQVREAYGFVWIALDESTPPLEDFAGDLHDELTGYDFDRWAAPYTEEWRIEANYKTVIDAFNETWHVPFTHKNTVKGGLLWRDAVIELMPPHSLLAVPVRGRGEGGGDHRSSMLCHYLWFPNTIFNCFADLAQIFCAWPEGPRSTVVQAWAIMPEEAAGTPRADRDWAHFCAVVAEDVGVLESAAEIVDSRGFRRNMFNAAEGCLTAYHDEMNRRAG